jgi:hypothetical protein
MAITSEKRGSPGKRESFAQGVNKYLQWLLEIHKQSRKSKFTVRHSQNRRGIIMQWLKQDKPTKLYLNSPKG